MVGAQRRRWPVRRARLDLVERQPPAGVEHEGLEAVDLGQLRRECGVGQHEAGAAVGEDVRQAVARVLHVEGQMGATGLLHGQHGDDELRVARQRHRDHRLRSGAARAQPRGQRRGARVELRVGEPLVAGDERQRIRGALDVTREQRGQRERLDLALRRVEPP
jgi:hypothetical protein